MIVPEIAMIKAESTTVRNGDVSPPSLVAIATLSIITVAAAVLTCACLIRQRGTTPPDVERCEYLSFVRFCDRR